MKNCATYLLALVALLASCTGARNTIAKGKIESTEPYTVYVREFSENNKAHWVEWPYWSMYDAYDCKAEMNDRIMFIFVTECTKDTTTLYINAGYKKQRIERNIRLDGGTYEVGTWPFIETLESNANGVR